jgi:hypothetical protein
MFGKVAMCNSTTLSCLVQKDLSLIKRRNKDVICAFGGARLKSFPRLGGGSLSLSLSLGRGYYHPVTKNYFGTKEIKKSVGGNSCQDLSGGNPG